MYSKTERIKIMDLDHPDEDFIERYIAAREPIEPAETVDRLPVDFMIERRSRG